MVEKRVFGPIRHGATPSLQRADLEFYRINHFRPSYVAHIYFNDPEIDEASDSADRKTYAGRFTIFGHQTCVGDPGHCVNHPPVASRFDDRPSHPLTRAFKRVLVTDALRNLLTQDELNITVIATTDPQVPREFEGPLLDFEGLQLAIFDGIAAPTHWHAPRHHGAPT
jgi:hypothetical protein